MNVSKDTRSSIIKEFGETPMCSANIHSLIGGRPEERPPGSHSSAPWAEHQPAPCWKVTKVLQVHRNACASACSHLSLGMPWVLGWHLASEPDEHKCTK